jgi:hypothetical protein
VSKQFRLPLKSDPMPKPARAKRSTHEDANRECARIILESIEEYGEESLPVEWARRIAAKEGA